MNSISKSIITAMVAVIAIPSIASALNEQRTWQQRSGYGATNNFSDSRNWSPSLVPGAQNNVVYNSSSNTTSVMNTSVSVASLTLDSSYTRSLNFSSGSTLTIVGGVDAENGLSILSSSATINLSNGTIDARNATNFVNKGIINQSGSGKVLFNAEDIMVTDSVGLPIGEVDLGNELFVTVIDKDENVNGNVLDTTTVIISNLINGDLEEVTLTETEVASGIFTNIGNGFLTSNDVISNPGNGKLEGEAGDTLSVEYVDNEDGLDAISTISSFKTDCGANAVAGSTPLDCNNNLVSDACEFSRGCPGIVLGDMNCDSSVDGNDMQNFIASYVSSSYTCQVDMNQDGNLNQVDMLSFVDTLLRP